MLQPNDGPFTWAHARALALVMQPGLEAWLQTLPVESLPVHVLNLLLFAVCTTVRPLPVEPLRNLLLLPSLSRRGGGCTPAVPPVLTASALHTPGLVVAAQLDAHGLLLRIQTGTHSMRLAHRAMAVPWVASRGTIRSEGRCSVSTCWCHRVLQETEGNRKHISSRSLPRDTLGTGRGDWERDVLAQAVHPPASVDRSRVGNNPRTDLPFEVTTMGVFAACGSILRIPRIP